MLGSADNLILYILIQVDKESAVASHADYQAAVLLRMKLCLNQRLLCENIKLDMHTSQRKISTNQRNQILTVPIRF